MSVPVLRCVAPEIPDGTFAEDARLEPSFFQRQTLTVAKDLLGKWFVRSVGDEILAGRIVEVEAYRQHGDEAAHTYGGKTKRNEVMFRDGGYLYVYFTYGMHFCMNVVTEKQDTGAAVLIRAIEPVLGIEQMHSNRGGKCKLRELTSGPARCCQAFGIQREQNGLSLADGELGLYDAPRIPAKHIEATTRIGIKKSVELPWRFVVRDNYFLSRQAGKNTLSLQLI